MSRKTVLKVVRYVVGGILFLVLAVVAVVYGVSSYKFSRKHSVQPREIPIPNTAAAIERGRHIVTTRGCMDCHGKDLGGAKVVDDPMVARFFGSNLTRGVGGVPADFGDIDFLRAIRHGVARDGRPLVLMPSYEYSMMSDEDMAAVIAYVKSVPPVDRPRGPVSAGPIGRLLTVLGEFKLSAEEIDHDAKQIASITPAVSADYGKYLSATCIGCHGPNMSGGKIPGGPPDWPPAANLTPHSSGRLSEWTEAQFVAALRTQKRPDGTQINPVMPAAFGQMTDLELKAMWAYISTLPAAETGVR
jgi:mono/diheme cytochrome c family protein